MVHLVNSAMMPTLNFTYRARAITHEQLAHEVARAYEAGVLRGYIGYETTAQFIVNLVREVTGVEIPAQAIMSREATSVAPGDVMIGVRISYRLADPRQKARGGIQVTRANTECFYVTVEAQ